MISYVQQKLTSCCKRHNKIIQKKSWWLLWLLMLGLVISFPAFAFDLPNQAIQYAKENYGTDAVSRLIAWRDLINSNKKNTELEKLRVVTDFFNAIPYQSDQEVWNKPNFWANPLELIGKNAGDCEDYAIAKYLTLKAMGVPSNKMRIVYVVSNQLKRPHMILAYYETSNSQPLILDSMTLKILYASERPDLRPVYMFSENAIWVTQDKTPPKEIIAGVQIQGWKQLITRMQQEGLTEDDLKP
jgi:predicted transglutaminase-like cysteine proteinase